MSLPSEPSIIDQTVPEYQSQIWGDHDTPPPFEPHSIDQPTPEHRSQDLHSHHTPPPFEPFLVDEATPEYQYQDLSDRHIRLLKVSYEPSSSILQFEIIVTSIDNSPPFHALSYVWGSGERPSKLPIQCGNTQEYLSLTKNLAEALQYLPKHMKTPWLWIDQLCINQKNPLERGHQILLMGEIYRTAIVVLIWLGPGHNTSMPLDRVLEMATNNDRVVQIMESYKRNSEEPVEELEVMRLIFEYPWFTRAWVVQEAALARKTCVIVGPSCFTWETLQLLGFLVSESGRISFGYGHHLTGRFIWIDGQENCETIQDRALHLCRFLAHTGRFLHATDERDKVLAYLGLWKPSTFPPEDVYDMKLATVYRHFARSVIEESQSLDILGASNGVKEGNSGLPDLPTWAPNWSMISLRAPSRILGVLHKERIWKASNARKHLSTAQSSDDPILQVRGKIVDVIQYASGVTIWTRTVKDPPYSLEKHCVVDMIEDAMSYDLDIPPQETLDMFYRAASGGDQPDPLYSVHRLLHPSRDDVDPYPILEVSIITQIKDNLWSRVFMQSYKGARGLVPDCATPGDSIAILHGSHVPVVLRKAGGSSMYQFVGDCYVEGMMLGEAVDWEEDDADTICIQ